MSIINLTPHAVQVYDESQFTNLEQVNPTTWVADGVVDKPIAEYPSQGMARIKTHTQVITQPPLCEDDFKDVMLVETIYGEATGVPEVTGQDHFIVSLPMQSMAKQAALDAAPYMVSPYKVVRSRQNGSLVLGCMGFTY